MKYAIEVQDPQSGVWLRYAEHAYTFNSMTRAEIEAVQLEGYFPGTKFRVAPVAQEPVLHPEVW